MAKKSPVLAQSSDDMLSRQLRRIPTTLVRPCGPAAIVGILLSGYYSTLMEREGLVSDLLASRDVEHICKLLICEEGRKCLDAQLDRAYCIVAEWGNIMHWLTTFAVLPPVCTKGRLTLIRKIATLGHGLLSDPAYHAKFAGLALTLLEREILLRELGHEALVDRLLRKRDAQPVLCLAS